MAKKTQPVQKEKVPVNNEQRMEALEEQKRNLEASYQKVLGAMELLQAIIEEEKLHGKSK